MQQATEALTVSQLNRQIRQLIEHSTPPLWIQGEISDLATPRSGHCYFTLKDQNARVRCALFRHNAQRLRFELEVGAEVKVFAKVSLYESRGDYQLIAERVEAAGEGVLQQAWLKLKKRLQAAGLFAAEHKQALPAHPKRIGIITSATGAAVHDILTTLADACPHIPIVIYPTSVQGYLAAPAISKAIAIANLRQECDVLILARGGGSMEDLWPFNEEMVVKAIFNSKLPIVCGIGHEVDVTLADLAADLRAATPTAAAQCICHGQLQYNMQLLHLSQQLKQCIRQHLLMQQHNITSLQNRLQHQHPRLVLQRYKNQCAEKLSRLKQLIEQKIQYSKLHLQQQTQALDVLSPLKTLHRGYAILSHQKQGIITSCARLEKKDRLQAKVVDGEMTCEIIEVKKNPVNAKPPTADRRCQADDT